MMKRDEALAWLAGIFEEPVEAMTPDRPRDEIAGWDSLGVLTLMADLDEKFDIQLDEKAASAMTHVRDLLALLESRNAVEKA